MAKITYHVSPPIDNDALNQLFAAAWPNHQQTDFHQPLSHSLLYVCAYAPDTMLIGFVNVAWDGGVHAFLLDTTVHPDYQRQGIGTTLVREAATAAAARNIDWIHVDFEPHLLHFYRACGFRHTEAGLINLANN